jgi:Uma2 family endonuclease
MARSKQRATYDDLLKLPENLVGEIIDGELIASPRPGPAHASAATGVSGQIWGPFHRATGDSGGPGGWWILSEPELHLHGDVLVPDVAGWRRERMAQLPKTAAFELPPDWVCEVLSPSTVRHDRLQKTKIYARERVGHLWLVEPLSRTLEVFRLEGDELREVNVFTGGDKVTVEPFALVELDLSRWWAD